MKAAANPILIFWHEFTLLNFKQSDWMLKTYNQSECLKLNSVNSCKNIIDQIQKPMSYRNFRATFAEIMDSDWFEIAI